jgi:hypothetical protein
MFIFLKKSLLCQHASDLLAPGSLLSHCLETPSSGQSFASQSWTWFFCLCCFFLLFGGAPPQQFADKGVLSWKLSLRSWCCHIAFEGMHTSGQVSCRLLGRELSGMSRDLMYSLLLFCKNLGIFSVDTHRISSFKSILKNSQKCPLCSSLESLFFWA